MGKGPFRHEPSLSIISYPFGLLTALLNHLHAKELGQINSSALLKAGQIR